MNSKTIYTPSEKVVSRIIKGRLIIVPIEDGVADLNDVMFSFNETGTKIWECMENKLNLEQICTALAEEYDADMDRIEKSVLKLVNTLLEKRIIVEWKN